ncbi:SGNH/GDSL hydrolase family protein [Marinobacter salinexigens]|uniref:SGNH/GDSL hydrolase family protein n=1 Tax=Marinobacter salinexigens TaxID=2919747 RepID=A0A5B0V7Q5_9GAMM|nr:SGNH/GDSL hydrolase family protein [Marinobacter salinexigens]KAA1170567.1 SGNH/GDSL hydrolase family protein [Marinobacter salinexigens]
MHIPFWLTTVALLPLLLYQGKRTRRVTPRLAEAGGDTHGQYGEGEPDLRILVIGESTAAGVGIERHDQGLASQLARLLHQRTGQVVSWHTYGVNGIRLTQLNRNLLQVPLPAADLVLLSMGVNDTTGFTRRSRFQQQLLTLRATLAERYPRPVQLLSVPPMHRFTALPAPLRQVMGWRARQLDHILRRTARERPESFTYLDYPAVVDPTLLARDGYHPSAKGYQAIAQALVGKLPQT